MDRPLKVRINPSRIAVYYCLLVTGLSYVAISLADLNIYFRALFFIVATVLFFQAFYTQKFSLITGIECQEENWFLHSGLRYEPVKIGRKFFLGLGIISLQLQRESGKVFYLVLWPDSADEDCLRRLRIRLLAIQKR
jgi:hypothetical protein